MINDYYEKFNLLNSLFLIINKSSYERILSLIKIDDGWDGKDSLQIKLESLKTMVSFVKSLNHIYPNNVAIFIDFEGYLIFETFNLETKASVKDIHFKEGFIEYIEAPYEIEELIIYEKDFKNLTL